MSALSWRTERCAPRLQLLGRQLGEPALDEVQPRARLVGREVQDEARVRGQPAAGSPASCAWRSCRARDGRRGRRGPRGRWSAGTVLNSIARWRACRRPMTLPVARSKRGVEAGGARALVVVGRALGRAGQHRQDRRGAVERLDLGLLVDAEHDGALGRVEVEADDVADLGDELRVLGELPRLLAVRLQPERLPDPVHRRLGQADLARHRARRPMRRVPRRGLQRLDDHLLDLLVGDRPRLPRPRLIDQPIQAMLGETRERHLRDHRPLHPEPLGDLGVLQTLGRQQHDPRALRQRLRARAPPRPRLQLRALLARSAQSATATRIGHTPPIPRCHRINASRHSTTRSFGRVCSPFRIAACHFPGTVRSCPRRAAPRGTPAAGGRSSPTAAGSRRPSRRGGSAPRSPFGGAYDRFPSTRD